MTSVSAAATGRTAAIIRRGLTAVVFIIAGLAFAFGFGNGWLLGLSLGVPGWIAPLVAPAVDLSVVALLATLHYLRAQGLGGQLIGPRLLLAGCGLITCALNTARPVLAGAVGRACFDAVAPLLLIGWSEVGPRLLELLHSTVPDDLSLRTNATTGTPVPDDFRTIPDRPPLSPSVLAAPPAPSPELLTRARQLDADHRARTGRPIPRDLLRREMHISNAKAGELLHVVRAPPKAR